MILAEKSFWQSVHAQSAMPKSLKHDRLNWGNSVHILDIFDFIMLELMLFAAVGFAIGGIDELIVDILWIIRTFWRRITVFTRYERATVKTLLPAQQPGTLAIFIAAWDESDVIIPMLTQLLYAFGAARYHVFIGCYPNDPKTCDAIATIPSQKLTIAINARDGPTTKADCLNTIWHAMLAYEQQNQMLFKAIILHDAEDVTHPAEPVIFDRMIEQFALVQLPVHPLVHPTSKWISGHYCDEFAESHAKALVVREAIGAALPAAGVGCAISRAMIEKIALHRKGKPFDADSLTEDYEMGLRIKNLGGRAALIRIQEHQNGDFVSIRAHFPSTIRTAVRQKTRWTIGIALAGWDRMGWGESWVENWMRLRDRRALITAILLFAGYIALILFGILSLISVTTGRVFPRIDPFLSSLLSLNAAMLLWRLAVRMAFVTSEYCWREGLRSIPRAVIGNIIAIMSARRALFQYVTMQKTLEIKWDKTEHKFPKLFRND